MLQYLLLGFLVSISTADLLQKGYLPPSHAVTSGGSSDFLKTPRVPVTLKQISQSAPRLRTLPIPLEPRGLYDAPHNVVPVFRAQIRPVPVVPVVPKHLYDAPASILIKSEVPAVPNGFYGAPVPIVRTPGVPVPSVPRRLYDASIRNIQLAPVGPPAAILRSENENDGLGSYRYSFETDNHIAHHEQGQLKNEETLSAQGSYSYKAPDGQVFTVNYIADENGFQAQGDHIPTAPPVPIEILKSLEQNAADEAAGIFDDGQYRSDLSDGGQIKKYLAPVLRKDNEGYKY